MKFKILFIRFVLPAYLIALSTFHVLNTIGSSRYVNSNYLQFTMNSFAVLHALLMICAVVLLFNYKIKTHLIITLLLFTINIVLGFVPGFNAFLSIKNTSYLAFYLNLPIFVTTGIDIFMLGVSVFFSFSLKNKETAQITKYIIALLGIVIFSGSLHKVPYYVPNNYCQNLELKGMQTNSNQIIGKKISEIDSIFKGFDFKGMSAIYIIDSKCDDCLFAIENVKSLAEKKLVDQLYLFDFATQEESIELLDYYELNSYPIHNVSTSEASGLLKSISGIPTCIILNNTTIEQVFTIEIPSAYQLNLMNKELVE